MEGEGYTKGLKIVVKLRMNISSLESWLPYYYLLEFARYLRGFLVFAFKSGYDRGGGWNRNPNK